MSEVETSPQAKAIIRAVLALGQSLDIPVLAEGVETHSQLSILRAEGCNEAQGYLLGRPAPFAEILARAHRDDVHVAIGQHCLPRPSPERGPSIYFGSV